VRGDKLESTVWYEIGRVLANPGVVLQELENRTEAKADVRRITRLESEIASLAEREERLVRLYTLGNVSDEIVQKQSEEISRERAGLEQLLSTLQRPTGFNSEFVDGDLLKQVCLGVTQWLEKADEADKREVLEALQVSVEATASTVTLTGVLPLAMPEFIKDEQSCRCLFSGEYKFVGFPLCRLSP
jgi:hypothetical protein